MKKPYASCILLFFIITSTQVQCSQEKPKPILKKSEEFQYANNSKKIVFNEIIQVKLCEKYPPHTYSDAKFNLKSYQILKSLDTWKEKGRIPEEKHALLVKKYELELNADLKKIVRLQKKSMVLQVRKQGLAKKNFYENLDKIQDNIIQTKNDFQWYKKTSIILGSSAVGIGVCFYAHHLSSCNK